MVDLASVKKCNVSGIALQPRTVGCSKNEVEALMAFGCAAKVTMARRQAGYGICRANEISQRLNYRV
jgi:hypothetical protein